MVINVHFPELLTQLEHLGCALRLCLQNVMVYQFGSTHRYYNSNLSWCGRNFILCNEGVLERSTYYQFG